MTHTQILACGAFGGICPSIAKLASTYSTDPTTPMPFIGVYIAMALFAILGSGVALGFGAREVKAAIIAGIAAPGIVTNVVAGANERQQQLPDAITMSFFASPAYAQTPQVEAILINTSGRILTVIPQVVGDIGPDGIDFTFETATGMTLHGTTLYSAKNPSMQIVVPANASMLVIAGQRFPLSPDASEAVVQIQTSPTVGGDLLWALGGNRNYQIGEITVLFAD